MESFLISCAAAVLVGFTMAYRMITARHWVRYKPRQAVAAAFFAGILLVAAPLGAQEAPEDSAPPAPAAELSAAERDALVGAVTGTPDGLQALNDLLTEGDASTDEITTRAKSLLQQLKEAGFIEDASAVMTAADRIIQAAVSNVSGGAKIVEFSPSNSFVPPDDVIALDFGPADGHLAAGFERVTNQDSRISGGSVDGLQAIRRPGQDGLQSDGLLGVNKLKVKMTKTGRWRIILMTEAVGEGGSVTAPFGASIIVNGVEIPISTALPDDWVRIARLKEGGESVAQVFDPGDGSASARFVGGIIILEVDIPSNVLEIAFNNQNNNDAQTYLTGAIFEPADQESILDLPPEAEDAIFSDDKRLQAEADVGQLVAEVLAELVPEAGDEEKIELLDLPEPILEDEQLASPS